MERPTRAEIAKSYKKMGGPGAEAALADLEAFCYEHMTTFVAGDPYATALNEGKRLVLKHIQFYKTVDPKTLEVTRG